MNLSGNASPPSMYPVEVQCTENRNCATKEEEHVAMAMAIDTDDDNASVSVSVSVSESDAISIKNTKRNKHRKHWILQSGYKLHGTLNKTKYRILKCIGKGRFSHVFSAYDEIKRRNVAIKVDTNPKEKELLLFEYEIMRSFANLSPYICKVYDFGKLPKDIGIGNFLCMELCHEKNLSDKRKECPSKCFGIQKGAMIGVEIILSLKEFHEKGFVHRDIKPSNFVLPLTTYWKHHVYIVDFGLSKKFNYKACKVQKEAEFIGTSLYASITAHNKLDLAPIDDLWSVAFVIIDISTNALPWKPLYIQLENQSKLRRTQVGKLKNSFIQEMLSNDSTLNTNTYQMPKEYKEFICTLNETKYNETPNYDALIRILRRIAANDEYSEEQYVADHAPLMMDRPLYTNFEILNDANLDRQILNESILCRKFIANNHYCPSNRPRGSWCEDGYHWTLNDEMHYRNTNELPAVRIVTQNICNGAMQRMQCDSDCTRGMQHIWNDTAAFSRKKPFWGQKDVDDFMQFGLMPRGIPYERRLIDINHFTQYLSSYIQPHYDELIRNSLFCAHDFAHDAVMNAWFKLNVSQSIAMLKDLSSATVTREHKRQFLMEAMHRAHTRCIGPNDMERTKLHQIQYPALFKKTNFDFNFDFRDCNAQPILERLEEFVRHARGKNIGNMDEIMAILMSVPCKYAIEVLDEVQNMGLQKISVIQSAIKRSCDQKHEWIERLEIKQQNQNKTAASLTATPHPVAHSHNDTNTNKMHQNQNQNQKIKCIKSTKSVALENKTSIGNLGYLDHVLSDTKQSSNYIINPQQRNKFNYSRVRSYINAPNTNRINRHPLTTPNHEKSAFKMLIPKKKHLIGGNNNNNNNHNNNRSVIKNIAKKINKKVNHKKKKKNKKKLKQQPVKKRIDTVALMAEDDDDDDDIVNIKNRNHRKRKRAIDDSSDDEEDISEIESSDSDDDIPIGRKRKKKRKRNINENEKEAPNKKKRKYNVNSNDYAPQRLTRKRNKNISYREEENEHEEEEKEEREHLPKSLFLHKNMRRSFAEIFGDNNTFVMSRQLTVTYDGMAIAKQLDTMKDENMRRAKKEIERDIACDLVSKYKTALDQNTVIVPSAGVLCFKCHSDPNDMEWELLLCEYCPKGAAHCSCIVPMYCSVPEGAWACDECQNEIIKTHQDEYNHIVRAKIEAMQPPPPPPPPPQPQPQPHPQPHPQPQPPPHAQPKSFTNNQPVFSRFFPMYPPPQQHGLTMLNAMDSRMINNETPLPPSLVTPLYPSRPAPQTPQTPQTPQIFDQFLHALNQKNTTQATNTININRLNVTNISCSNFNGGIPRIPAIPTSQQSNNQCMSQSQSSLQITDDNMNNEQTCVALGMRLGRSNIIAHKWNEGEWPIHSTKIILQPRGHQRRKRRFEIVGCYPNHIYSDYYYSPSLFHQRNNK